MTPTPGPGDLDWQQKAACAQPAARGVDFFATDAAGVAAAQRVCAGCPVRTACLAWAQEENLTDGVWGGGMFGPPVRVSSVRVERHDGNPHRRANQQVMAPKARAECRAQIGELRQERQATATEVGAERRRRAAAPRREQQATATAARAEQRRRITELRQERHATGAAIRAEPERRNRVLRTERQATAAVVAANRRRLVQVDSELLAAAAWIAQYLNAYVPQVAVGTAGELVTAAVRRELSDICDRWGIVVPDHVRAGLGHGADLAVRQHRNPDHSRHTGTAA